MPSKAILAAIGRVAAVSAGIEDTLHSLHWRLAGLSDKIGPVVTGDLRANRLAEDTLKIARLAQARKPIIDDLADIISDFKSSAQQRNELVHWIWDKPKGRKHAVTPPSYRAGYQTKHYSLKEVESLADDLVWIEARLLSHLMTDEEIIAEREHHGHFGSTFVPAPWLDKPLQTGPKPSANPDSKKSKQPRPQS